MLAALSAVRSWRCISSLISEGYSPSLRCRSWTAAWPTRRGAREMALPSRRRRCGSLSERSSRCLLSTRATRRVEQSPTESNRVEQSRTESKPRVLSGGSFAHPARLPGCVQSPPSCPSFHLLVHPSAHLSSTLPRQVAPIQHLSSCHPIAASRRRLSSRRLPRFSTYCSRCSRRPESVSVVSMVLRSLTRAATVTRRHTMCTLLICPRTSSSAHTIRSQVHTPIAGHA